MLLIQLNLRKTHDASGSLVGPGSAVAGSAEQTIESGRWDISYWDAARWAGTQHETSGALIGAGSSIVGAATKIPNHITTGALIGAGSLVVGASYRTRQHSSSGALSGVGSSVVGAADRNHYFSTEGSLVGPGAVITGDAQNINDINHACTGVLVGPGSEVVGEAERTPAAVNPVIADIGPGDEKQRKKAQKKRDEAFEREKAEREGLRQQIKQAVTPVVAKAEPVVVSEGTKSVQVLSLDGSRLGIAVPPAFDPAEVAKIVGEVLEAARIEAQMVQRRQDAERALQAARVAMARIIKRKREDELLLLID